MEAGEIALGIAITNSVISGLTFAYFYVQHRNRMMEIQSLFNLDKELLGLVLITDNLREMKSKVDKACDVPPDSIHKEAVKAAELFRDTLGLAAEIKAKRMARENKETNP